MLATARRFTAGYLDTIALSLRELPRLAGETERASLVRQIYFTGVRALPVISVFALLFGAVIVTSALALLGADNEAVIKSVVWGGLRELAPMAAAIIILSRSSVAIAAELALMRLRDGMQQQLWQGAVNEARPVMPRVLGLALSGTMLVGYFQFIAFASALTAASMALDTTLELEIKHFLDAAQWWQIPLSLIKGTLFGAGIGVISCYHGLAVAPDVREVPKAVMAASIGSLTWVCVVDAFAALLLIV